mgnify:CR=1 FL=1
MPFCDFSLQYDGIALMEGPSGSVAPGGEDVFFGGDVNAWINAARATKSRGLLHRHRR